MKTKRAYQFRFYPDPQQETLLAQTFGCVRYVYNSILRYRTDAYYQAQEKVGYTKASSQLTAIKKLPEATFLNDVSSVPLQQCLRNQQTAFKTSLKVGQNTLSSNLKSTANRLNSRTARSATVTVN
ncbi:helix-turn-helix domain-containing protein [Thiothrix lacustris]|uniref:helix-turn-helix domain-containing protein n=1 Tax=Thiothrix lacustris TaxID=525917 RepID=UPI0027E4EC83|nr:helix-turn-helix domain-containing protein [Thiothrix lacustris]WMP16461.1 helix-turn-helix domain-containing protein [Thiothrix lacustris]